MMLVSMKEMLADAKAKHYDIPAFDVSNYEMMRAVLDSIKAAIDAGFSSVMFDGSVLPFEENAKKTAEIAAYALIRRVSRSCLKEKNRL